MIDGLTVPIYLRQTFYAIDGGVVCVCVGGVYVCVRARPSE